MSRTAGKQRPGTPDVAVVAHCRKSFGGGLPELRKVPYELDGGARPPRKDVRIKARPASITICVPAEAGAVFRRDVRGD